MFRHEVRRDGAAVHVMLAGVMGREQADAAIADFERAIAGYDEFEMRVLLRGLEKYDAPARVAWTEALRKCRRRISVITLVGARPLVRMAASTVAMVLRLPMRFEE